MINNLANVTILVGTNDSQMGGYRYHLSSIIINEHFSHSIDGIFNDIALLQTTKPIIFIHGRVNSICLPRTNSPTPKRALVVGWASSHILLKATVNWFDWNHCQTIYSNWFDFRLSNKSLCYDGQLVDACNGDSGGPLQITHSDGSTILIGLVSHGAECGRYPGIYTDVREYINWIMEIIDS